MGELYIEAMDDLFAKDAGFFHDNFAGSLTKRFGIPEGTPLPRSIIEYYYKSDELGNPMVSEEHITAFGWAGPQDLDDMMRSEERRVGKECRSRWSQYH